MYRILIAEDNRPVANLVATHLSFAGYEATCVFDGDAALEVLQEETFDLLILDLMLPGKSGVEIIEQIRDSGILIIVLTARDDLDSKVQCLKMGADDYITKPFESIDLLVRIEALLRRFKPQPKQFKLGQLEIDPQIHQVIWKNKVVDLAPKEFELLYYLAQNHDQVLTRKDILNHVWGYLFVGETRTVDIHIRRLRHKMGLENEIQTITKVGYLLKGSAFE